MITLAPVFTILKFPSTNNDYKLLRLDVKPVVQHQPGPRAAPSEMKPMHTSSAYHYPQLLPLHHSKYTAIPAE